MDSSPSKRRRTSPSTSITVTAENTFLAQLPQNGASPSKRRSSFMSPTKASLARFYPSLLPRAKSAEPPRPVGRGNHTPVEQHLNTGAGTNGTVPHVAGTAAEDPKLGTNGVDYGQGLLATLRRRSRTPGEDNTLAKQGRSMMSSGLRASSPEEVGYKGPTVSDTNGEQQEPAAEAVDVGSAGVTIIPDSQNPQLPSTPPQPEPHVPTSGMGIGEDGELSLPSTPSQLGLEPPRKRPTGPLLTSPSKRLRRRRTSTAKSSPLKSLVVPQERSNERQEALVASLGPRRYIANTPKPPPSPEDAHLLHSRSRLGALEKQLQEIQDKLLRQLLVSSWQQDRSRDGKDTAKRRKDVCQRSTKVVQLREEILHIQAAQSVDHGQIEPGAVDQEVASPKATTLSQRLAKYLPFAIKPPSPAPRPPSPRQTDMNQVPDLDELQTTAEPFTVTTSNTSLLPSTSNENLLQRTKVTLSTAYDLLTCDLQVTANTTTQQISHLDIQALSPWAEPELGSWLRRRLPPEEEMEPAALGRAFGRYWEAVKLRNKCWIGCTQDFQDIVVIANAPSSSSTTTTTSEQPPNSNSPSFHLGAQDLVLARSNVQLSFHWAITLNENGEAESQSSAHATFPPAFYHHHSHHRRQQQRDEEEEDGGEEQGTDSELSRIGDAFAMLVEDRGISEAVGVVCRIVFPT